VAGPKPVPRVGSKLLSRGSSPRKRPVLDIQNRDQGWSRETPALDYTVARTGKEEEEAIHRNVGCKRGRTTHKQTSKKNDQAGGTSYNTIEILIWKERGDRDRRGGLKSHDWAARVTIAYDHAGETAPPAS